MHREFDRRAFLRAAAGLMAFGIGRSVEARQAAATALGALPIIDTHQHLWDLKRFNLPWLAGAPKSINRNFLQTDFQAAVGDLNVVRSVYMEVDVHPAQQIQEAEFAIELCGAPESTVSGAVIGGYPHEKGFADLVKRFAGVKCIKGFRTVLHGNRPRGLCLQPAFIDSMKRLGEADLKFDLCMRPGELLDGAQVAAQAPQTTFILDHCGNIGAEIDPALRSVWCEGLKAAAAQPNVVCKISGVVDKLAGRDWTPDLLAENINFCLDAFVEDRVVFGGDSPVCLLGGSYRRWVESLAAIVCDRPDPFRKKLFHDNAARVYRVS